MVEHLKIGFILFAGILLSASPFLPARPPQGFHAIVIKKNAGGGGGGFLYQEKFEGTGTPASWTNSGSPDYDYATTPAPLEGTKSLRVVTSSSSVYAYYSITSTDTVYLYYIVDCPDFDSFENIVGLRSGTTQILQHRWGGNNAVSQIYISGLTTLTTVSPFNEGTTYHCWLEYTASSGASDGVVRFYYGTTATKGTVYYETTTHNETGSVDRIYFGDSGTTTMDLIFDNFVYDDEAIGSSP